MSDGEQLVAKRFFQLNDDADPVSIPENRNEVQSELLRLAWGKWFLSAFYQFCKQRKEVNVDEGGAHHSFFSHLSHDYDSIVLCRGLFG
jgi:hypothetical protein